METDNELTSGTLSGTEETIGSSELNPDEAEALTRSMDMSMAFWGTSKEPPEKISATRLKCPIQRSSKASRLALQIWEKMTQRDLDKVKEIEVSLMREGEIATLDLVRALKYIIESIGYEFEEMLKSVNEDPIESTISLTNEILHIFNLNEPPEIADEEDYRNYLPYSPVSNRYKQNERQRNEICHKMKLLLDRAHQMGIHDVRIPSSPYLTERSKLSLIEKQITSKIRLRNVKRVLENAEGECTFGESKLGHSMRYQKRKSSHQKKDFKRPSLADRPKFRTAVKSESVRYEDLFKHTPDINKRLRKVREMRKKFMEKSKNTEGKSSNLFNGRNTRNRHLATPYNNYSSYILSYKGKTPKVYKRCHMPQMQNPHIRDYNLNESKNSTRVIGSSDKSQTVDSFKRSSSILQRHDSREKILSEVKKMVNEAVQAVTGSNRQKHSMSLADQRKPFRIKPKERNQNSKMRMNGIYRAMHPTTNALKARDESSNSSNAKDKNDTFVTVKQEAAHQNIKKEENSVSTEVKVYRGFEGPGLKVSVMSKVSGNEETEEAPRSKSGKDIREAIKILKEYIALKKKEGLSRTESGSVQNGEDRSLMLTNDSDVIIQENITPSETVTKTEVIIEPDSLETLPKEEVYENETNTKSNEYMTWDFSQDGIDLTDRTYQTYAVTIVGSSGEDSRFYTPFQFGGLFFNRASNSSVPDQVGDVGDNGWSSWDSSVWQRIRFDDDLTTNVRDESDSLYVNSSEEQISSNNIGETGEDSIVIQQTIETTLSSLSLVVVENDTRSERSSYASMITSTASGIYRILINSILGVVAIFFKPFNIIEAFKLRRNENDQ